MTPAIKAKHFFYIQSFHTVTDQYFTATCVQWKWNFKVHNTYSILFS